MTLIALACGEEPVTEAPVARPVKILILDAGASAGVLEYPGKVSPAQQSDMAFEVPGKIIELPVRESQRVSKGTLLARIDPRDYQARLDSENAKLKQSRSDYNRYRELFEKDVVSKAEMERRQRVFGVAEAAVREAEKAVEDTYLRAPFDGRVAKKLVEDFQNVQAKEPVLILQDDSTLELVINVPERDLVLGRRESTPEAATARIKPSVTITSLPDQTFPARIKELSTTADPVTRTFEATFAFENPADVNILPGMTAKVSLTLPARAGQAKGYAIPASAVLADESGAAFVWVVDPSSMRVRRAPVVVGELSGAKVEVRSGLSSGDWIAVSGVHSLREGIEVRRFEK